MSKCANKLNGVEIPQMRFLSSKLVKELTRQKHDESGSGKLTRNYDEMEYLNNYNIVHEPDILPQPPATGPSRLEHQLPCHGRLLQVRILEMELHLRSDCCFHFYLARN